MICWYEFALYSIDYYAFETCSVGMGTHRLHYAPCHNTQIRNLLELKYVSFYLNTKRFLVSKMRAREMGRWVFFFLPCTACYLECLQALKMCKYKVYQIFTLFLSRFLCRSTIFFSKSLKPFETATAGWLIGVQFHSIWWLHCVITTYLD